MPRSQVFTRSQPSVMITRVGLAVVLALAAAACGGTGDLLSGGDEFDPAAAAAAATEDAEDVVAPAPETAGNGEDATEGGDGADDGTQTVLDPMSIPGEFIGDYDLLNGDCFNRIEDLQAGRRVVITSRVDCSTPHTYEVFHTFELDAPHPSVYPGDRVMTDFTRKVCYDHFEAFVGEMYELSIYEIGVFTPDRTNFEHEVARYRGVHCWLYRTDGEPMVASAQGTAT